MPWAQVEPTLDFSVRQLCARRYPGHPRGCPNHGRRPTCPPQAPLLPDVLQLDKPVWIVWNAFDLEGHVTRMRAKHPSWSWRQLSCCLYWQAGARRDLRAEIRKFQFVTRFDWKIIACPEACGVNVTAMMASAGVELEWPPRTVAYQVALVGASREEAQE